MARTPGQARCPSNELEGGATLEGHGSKGRWVAVRSSVVRTFDIVMKSVPRNTPVTPSKPRRATARGLWLLSTAGAQGERAAAKDRQGD